MSDTNPDGSVIVTPTVRDIVFTLASTWEQEGQNALDDVREQKGDYLARIEALVEDVSSQLRLLASGSWGAGTDGSQPEVVPVPEGETNYTVTLTNSFHTDNPEDAVLQMASYASDNAAHAGYRVYWTNADGREGSMFIDADDIEESEQVELG